MIVKIKGIINHLFTKKITIAKWQLNLFGVICLSAGLIAGSYLTLKGISRIFASSASSISKNTDADFSSGTLTNTIVSGTGNSAVVQLTTGIWGNSWNYRKKITFDNTSVNLGATSAVLTNFPVMVRLTATNFDFSKAQSLGQDIRFYDPDQTALNYEIEKWDSAGGEAIIWVNVPQIDQNSNSDYIYMYYGNGAVADAQNKTAVWDSNYQMVLHMNQASGATLVDSTNLNNVTKAGANNPAADSGGKIDGTQSFSGTGSDYGYAANGVNNQETTAYTLSGWAKVDPAGASKTDNIISKYAWGAGQGFGMSLEGGTTPRCDFNGGSGYWIPGNTVGAIGSWNFVQCVYNGSTMTLYINGRYANQVNRSGFGNWGGSLIIGQAADAVGNGQYSMAGKIDEVRLSKIARPAAYIAADYKSNTDSFNTFGNQEYNMSASGSWESPSDSNIIDFKWNGGWGDGTSESTAFSATVANVGASNTITFWMKTAATIGGLSSAAYIPVATASAGTTVAATKADLDNLGVGTGTKRYMLVKADFAQSSGINPQLDNFTINFLSDNTAPETNASGIAMLRNAGGATVALNGWTKNASPYFSWTAGADSQSGLKGYCLYLGTDSSGDPATAKGLLGTSPVSVSGSTCQFIVTGTSIDFATSSYKGGTWLSTSATPYYLNIKAIDNNNNIAASSAQFQFRYDGTAPTNVSYISCASGNFANVADMSFNWPVSGSAASADANAGLLGWQYQINSTSGTWLGTTTEADLDVNNYLPAGTSAYTLTAAQDGAAITTGTNIVYFRTIDIAGNPSSDSAIRTCNLTYGGAAPTFLQTDAVTVTPSTSTANSFALSWPAATPSNNRTIRHYYYMINTAPPASYSTITGNTSTYIDIGTSLSVAATALANVNKGSNTVYVVAVDDQGNYSPSNYITGTFTLNSTTPDNVVSLVASDSSIKSLSQWNVTLTWAAPSYQGAGNLTYIVKRSTDNVTFTQAGTTTGLSYVDNTPASALYYYKVFTKDIANAESSGTNAVSITPTGKWTSAPSLSAGPDVGSITTKKATITWSTSRSADSKIQYGTSPGKYGSVEPSNSDQVSSHSIQLTGLTAGTTYYYRTKWTDEDGNTATSDEKEFTTTPAPTTKNVSAKNIGLAGATIQYTVTNASSIKIYYGTTTSFGRVATVSTSTSETTYTTELTDLLDGIKYYYKINTFDPDGTEYDNQINDFTTLPRPKITNVRVQQVANTAQSAILVTWTTNTEVSSIVTYHPEGNEEAARDEVNIALTKGDHRMIIRGLLPQTDYILIVKGRDKIGNEATSDSQRITTATDTRPPQVSELHVEGSNIPPVSTTAQEQTAQLIVSWNTDEPATSQVEYGEGTGTSYAQKTLEDSNLTLNHMVIISNLTPSKVYHLRTISKDKAGNTGNSVDTATITPKATENALNLVITNLGEAFGFLGGLKQ